MQGGHFLSADSLNRRARLGVFIVLAVGALVAGVAALGDNEGEAAVLGSGIETPSALTLITSPARTTAQGPGGESSEIAGSDRASTTAITPDVEAFVTTTPAPVDLSSETTTTSVAPSPTKTVVVARAVPPAPATSTTTTTIPPTTTSTSTSTTTTSTTTTTSSTTTSTTVPGLDALKLHKFEGHDHGDKDDWEAHIKVEVRDEGDERVGFATVVIQWSGEESGEASFVTGKDGKLDERLGPFSNASLTFRVAGVFLDGYVYTPSLNEVPDAITIEVG